MEGKTKDKVDFDVGCGLVGKIFHLKTNNRPRKSSVHSLPMKACNTAQQREQAKNELKSPLNHEPKVPRDSAIGINPTLKGEQNPARKSSSSHRAPSAYRNTPNERPSDAARTSIRQAHDPNDESKQQKENSGNSLELARISTSASHHQNNETKSPAKEFVLPITGNLLVNSSPRTSVTKSKESNFMSGSSAYSSNGNKGVMGNIMRKNSNELAQFRSPRNSRADPEEMKSMGNEAYKLGRFEEALVLYDRAIALDSNKATYHCNKSAALMGLGRFLQAIVECEEAIRLEPSYGRAHDRLATIYFRLGEAEKALNCNETSPCVDSVLTLQAQALQNHLTKCTEARKAKDWKAILKETQAAVSLGADSAPQVYCLQTEALLKLLTRTQMELLSSLFGIIGFAVGIPIGLFVGFFLFVYSETKHVKDPVVRPISELGPNALEELLPEIPLWVKTPDYERIDWLNKFLLDMWPFLDTAICKIIRSTAQPIFAEYIGKYQIKAIEFDKLSLGTLPPTVCGIKVLETNEKELVMEQVIKWAGNPNIVLSLYVSSLKISVQLVDVQVFATPRITLRPLVPTFPCFANIVVSLLEKPHVDFGMRVSGGDIMSIPGLYRFVQDTIKKQVANLYLWPRTLEIPILDESTVEIKKPVGILHVNVVRAHKLLKMDLLGTSDPYVKLSLTGDKLPAKKTTVKRKNLNPVWNEKFKIVVKDPQSQVLQLQVYDWDKVGGHDKLGMQLVPLKLLKPYENKEFTLDLLKDTNLNETPNKKPRGKIVVDLTFVPFKEDSSKFGGPSEGYSRKESGIGYVSDDEVQDRAGLLSVVILEAEEVEGEHHNNPFAVLTFRGEKKKTKTMKKTRHPRWNEEFQFMLEEPPQHEKIHIEVLSRRKNFSFLSKQETLGHVEINLRDVVHNGRINDKYNLINSRNGVIHVDVRWKVV